MGLMRQVVFSVANILPLSRRECFAFCQKPCFPLWGYPYDTLTSKAVFYHSLSQGRVQEFPAACIQNGVSSYLYTKLRQTSQPQAAQFNSQPVQADESTGPTSRWNRRSMRPDDPEDQSTIKPPQKTLKIHPPPPPPPPRRKCSRNLAKRCRKLTCCEHTVCAFLDRPEGGGLLGMPCFHCAGFAFLPVALRRTALLLWRSVEETERKGRG